MNSLELVSLVTSNIFQSIVVQLASNLETLKPSCESKIIHMSRVGRSTLKAYVILRKRKEIN
jgi:hypothetical protein